MSPFVRTARSTRLTREGKLFLDHVPRVFAAMLTGCGPSEPTETVESLVTDLVCIKELRQQRKLARAKLGDELCSRVAEATRKRFCGDGKVPYTSLDKPSNFLLANECHAMLNDDMGFSLVP